MEILKTTGRGRETYNVQVKYSLLWECALGIAAITNSRLIETLEQSMDFWKTTQKRMSTELTEALDDVEKNNTWKSLLLLLHQQDFTDLSSFITYVNSLPEQNLRYQCIPFVGFNHQSTRYQASTGDKLAVQELKKVTKHNPFFPDYIEFICQIDAKALKQHLITVMSGWYREFIEPEASRVERYLKQDCAMKRTMMAKMDPEEFVEWATGGIAYLPEPSVSNVLLIPQYIYRPWNIEADIEGTKVFYYPVSNESIHPEDTLTPNYFLVHKHKALGDELRLRMVKLLYRKDQTLQEITNTLGAGKTTIHHHLKILRSAKLVDVQHATYSLRKNALQSLSKELDHYLNEG
ncbi:winged helix-turn-helix domain-containing protein [Lentibacillus sp. N15]|uniref:ArsR/SmtB family transcription factor n=1 Tax=Lentibacillus songyuanensis TaxID=3136161 RepID=UPI0031BA4367